MLDKERPGAVREAVEAVYQVFGADDLVITWGNDLVRPPERPCPPMAID